MIIYNLYKMQIPVLSFPPEVILLIVYKNILARLAAAGWSTLRLQRERQISNGTIMQIRAGRPITTASLDTICRLCHCQPGDLLEYREDPQEERSC